jgi:hypothetical protein
MVGFTAFLAFSKPGQPFAALFGGTTTSTPVPLKASSNTRAPTITPSATPSAQVAADRDAKRKADLALFVTAFRTNPGGGVYNTLPPTVTVATTDPTTRQAYIVTTDALTTVGKIQYLAGYNCTGKVATPGKTSTKYLAITTMLETSTAPYCLVVNQ